MLLNSRATDTYVVVQSSGAPSAMVLTEPGVMRAQRGAAVAAASPPLRVMSAMLAVGVCAFAAVLLTGSGPWAGGDARVELVSKAADLEATEVGAVERNHDILVQKSKVLAAKIGDLARTLKRQENSLTGSGKVKY